MNDVAVEVGKEYAATAEVFVIGELFLDFSTSTTTSIELPESVSELAL